MNMIKISQVLKLLLIASLLIITPLLSTSLRTTYLYFIVNLLIISLGAESGLISFFSKSPNDKKLPSTNIITQKQHNMNTPVIVFSPPGTSEHQETAPKPKYDHKASSESSLLITTKNNTGKVVEKCASDIIFGVAKVHEQVALVKKCPSKTSLFFIGGTTGEEINEAEEILKEEKYDDQNDEEVVVLSKQELFYKAETFIDNFYKQLKMQREDSWKSLHDFYHTAAF